MLTLLIDNETSISLTKNVESQVEIEHIDDIYYHILKLVEEEEIYIKQIFGSLILVNRLIKALLIAGLRKYRELQGLMDKNELLKDKESCKKKKILLSLHDG